MRYNERIIIRENNNVHVAMKYEDRIMTKTLTVRVTQQSITANWQEKDMQQPVPMDCTAEMVMDIFVSVVQDALAGDTPEAIEVSNELTGLVVLDEASHSVIPVLYAEEADDHFIEALTMNGIGGQLTRKNGHDLTTGTAVIQILRLKNNMADMYAKAAIYRPFTAYLRSMLTGQNLLTRDEARLTGMFDQLTNKWDTQALALTDLTIIQMPEIGEANASELTNHILLEKMSTIPTVKVR